MKLDRKILKTFEAHGVEFMGQRGDQMYGYDPFSGKENKFYVNMRNGLWDSKSTGLSGNLSKFLELTAQEYRKQIRSKHARKLAANRQLPVEAFKGWELGWDGEAFTFPVRDYNGVVRDIRSYDLNRKLMRSTAGCQVGLLGAHRLKTHGSEAVYLCEGEWDAIALQWMLRRLNEPGVVVGVPGAGTFKPEWVQWLQGRQVHTLYDYDNAGRKGEELVLERLKGHVRKLTFVHWPDEVPLGFDTRDWIVYGAITRDTAPECWEKLKRRFHEKPKWQNPETPKVVTVVTKSGRIRIKKKKSPPSKRWVNPPSLEQVHSVFNRWFFLRNTEVIDVMLATVLSQRIGGSPVWMFLVGPPGSAKTAIITSLEEVDIAYSTSTLTAPSLISGANFQGMGDPSLIPKLQDKVLVVKDFTAILSQPDREQKEIFGILRDAYDGRCSKSFGNGVIRKYESRFTVLAATTPRIYDLAEQHQSLGERFLKFMVGDNLHHLSEDAIIRRAIENADRESTMREELQDVVKNYLERTCDGRYIPKLPDSILHKIISLAKFGARLRGSVSRDNYNNDIMRSRPTAEVGTRLGQQLAKLSRGLAMVYGKKEVTESEYKLIKKVMLDTISQRNEDVLRTMIIAMGGAKVLAPISIRDLAHKTHYPYATIQRLIQDLIALQIVKRIGAGVQSTWTLSEYVRKEVQEADLYNDEDFVSRPLGRIRLLRKKKKKRITLNGVPIPARAVVFTARQPRSAAPLTPPATPSEEETEKEPETSHGQDVNR
jgi:MoxR-like ATPase